MRAVVPMTDKRLRSLQKTTACGIVPGLFVQVVKLSGGKLAKYFILRDREVNRVFSLGKYPEMSLSEAFAKAGEWKRKINAGIDPAAEEKERKLLLMRSKSPDERLTFEALIRKWIDFNEKRGRWSNTCKTKTEVWDGFFKNHVPESIRTCLSRI